MEKMEVFKETYQEINGTFLKRLGNAILVKLAEKHVDEWDIIVHGNELWIPTIAIFNTFFDDSTIEQTFLVKKEFLTIKKSITNEKEIQFQHRIIRRNKILFTIIAIVILFLSVLILYTYPLEPMYNPFQP